MNTNNLQSLLANNTRLIHMRTSLVSMHIEDAKAYKVADELSFSADSYQKADRQRSKLAKLVELQRALKAELQANYRDARIQSKLAKLVTVGFVYEAPKENMPQELELILDDLISAFIPKKADSRIVAEITA